MSELSERKIVILKAIIKNYLETGEPVGSRTISKLSGLNLSSATIRNEMSDLVEMGYIVQPHTSAGRIPSDKGYRFYVDSIIRENSDKMTAVTAEMSSRIDRLELLLKDMVQLIAGETRYAALISGPSSETCRIKYLQLSVPDEGQLLLIVVLDGNVIKNEVLLAAEPIDTATALDITVMLNNHLSGLSLPEITPRIITDIMVSAGEQQENVKLALDAAVEMLSGGEQGKEIFTSGTRNLFSYPEFADVDKATRLISVFEEKQALKDMVNEVTSLSVPGSGDFKVYIGEGPVKDMEDCSLVTANYDLGEGMKGVIGVIGPKRMDYELVMKTLGELGARLNESLGSNKKLSGETKTGKKPHKKVSE